MLTGAAYSHITHVLQDRFCSLKARLFHLPDLLYYALGIIFRLAAWESLTEVILP